MRKTSAESERFGVEEEFLSRLEPIFSLSEELPNIGTALNQFFASADDLSLNPSSNELRANFIERSTDLVNVIKDTYSSIADLQLEADLRIATEVEEVNNLTSQIAELNNAIAVVERGGEVAADGRDLRDQLLSKLSEKIEFNIVEQADGTATLSLKNGFAIVFGSEARELNATTTPSFAASSADLLGGGAPTYVTFDYSGAGTAEVDLSSMIARGNGTLSGLINTRGIYSPSMTSPFEADGSLVEIASRVEAITRSLLINVNATYIGPDRDPGTAGYQTSSVDLNGIHQAFMGCLHLAEQVMLITTDQTQRI
jgi:flagellar hook-associated protein FlgK